MSPGQDGTAIRAVVGAALDSIAVPGGPLRQWQSGTYEAEEAALRRHTEAMAVAHRRLAADSAAVHAPGSRRARAAWAAANCPFLLCSAAALRGQAGMV